jgi:hypothetical protein
MAFGGFLRRILGKLTGAFRGKRAATSGAPYRGSAGALSRDVETPYEVGFQSGVDSDGSDVGYHPAPSGNRVYANGQVGPSHLWGFRYRDRRVYRGLPTSRLDVVFRTKTGGPGTKGYYIPPSDDQGQQMFDNLVGSDAPYATWLRPAVIGRGWNWVEVVKVRG